MLVVIVNVIFPKFYTKKKLCRFCNKVNKTVKQAVPLQAWSGPEGSKKLRFPDFMTTA